MKLEATTAIAAVSLQIVGGCVLYHASNQPLARAGALTILAVPVLMKLGELRTKSQRSAQKYRTAFYASLPLALPFWVAHAGTAVCLLWLNSGGNR